MIITVLAVSALSQCVCEDMSLCSPLKTPMAKTEVVAFAPREDAWKGYNLSSLTTIMKFGTVDTEVVCEAHKVGVRVVLNTDFDNTQLGNETYLAAFIEDTRKTVKENGYDGYNFDIEHDTTGSAQLTSLVERTAAALRADNPIAQISFDTTISANNPGGYDYVALNKTLDFYIPMGYDMCWGSHTAEANSPMSGLLSGLEKYDQLGLLSKVVLGLPWYGYAFPCSSPSPSGGCHTDQTFSGAWSHTFDGAVQLEQNATTPGAYTPAKDARFFSYTQGGQLYQMYYDDAVTLAPKYELVKSKNLRGTAFWYAGCATTGTPQGVAMWRAIEGIKQV
eukprot:TRINITY_DN23414_c0_g1_i2.p1 TRINITY_DN23414_c0_g1~~TRINITY_DN23414_c0_g1_i2.p1  ORF type:complete len:335 (+),score=71.54 TRINITY_DN23414_c0_g1_i2:71-1075(+)